MRTGVYLPKILAVRRWGLDQGSVFFPPSLFLRCVNVFDIIKRLAKMLIGA